MHQLTRETLKRFKLEGILVQPEDAIALNILAEKTSKVSDQKLLSHSGIYCGNVEIFPLTLGAKVWLKTTALEWFENDEYIYNLCLFYSFAYSRDEYAFNFNTAKEARKCILKWAKGVKATEEEILILSSFNVEGNAESDVLLKELVEQITNHPNHLNLVPALKYVNKIERTDVDVGTTPIIAWLIANCGKTAEYWLWEQGWDSIEGIIENVQKQNSAEDYIDARDPSIMAMKKYHSKVIEIRKNFKKEI
jgi:hypothetical protein